MHRPGLLLTALAPNNDASQHREVGRAGTMSSRDISRTAPGTPLYPPDFMMSNDRGVRENRFLAISFQGKRLFRHFSSTKDREKAVYIAGRKANYSLHSPAANPTVAKIAQHDARMNRV
ncbi:MAG TPA: hypothetical protein VN047_17570 [Sphingopyxis sp.]|nr:hypothetical protein [Sphingopyxis sp.]